MQDQRTTQLCAEFHVATCQPCASTRSPISCLKLLGFAVDVQCTAELPVGHLLVSVLCPTCPQCKRRREEDLGPHVAAEISFWPTAWWLAVAFPCWCSVGTVGRNPEVFKRKPVGIRFFLRSFRFSQGPSFSPAATGNQQRGFSRLQRRRRPFWVFCLKNRWRFLFYLVFFSHLPGISIYFP